jgi:hypothetical protein
LIGICFLTLRGSGRIAFASGSLWHFALDRFRCQPIRELPKTTFRSWVDGGSSDFGVTGFIAAPSVCIFLTFDPLSLVGFRSFLVLIFAVQAAVRELKMQNSPAKDSVF